jgi:hypothetical protein
MNLADLQRALTAAARQNPPSDRVPYAFEKRIMARLAAAPRADGWALWGRALWGGAAACVAVAALAGLLSISALGSDPSNLSQDLEQTILAPVDDADAPW